MPRQITPPHFQGPIQIVGRVEGDETTDMFACPSRSALRSIDMPTGADKSQGHKVPRTCDSDIGAQCGAREIWRARKIWRAQNVWRAQSVKYLKGLV